jgi:hypothetical protein
LIIAIARFDLFLSGAPSRVPNGHRLAAQQREIEHYSGAAGGNRHFSGALKSDKLREGARAIFGFSAENAKIRTAWRMPQSDAKSSPLFQPV